MTDEPRLDAERHHPSSGGRFVIAVIALLVLTALSFGMHFVPLGGVGGAVIAFGIASVKVAIVGLVFMELRESLPATRLVAAVSVAFVVLLCLGIYGDIAFR